MEDNMRIFLLLTAIAVSSPLILFANESRPKSMTRSTNKTTSPGPANARVMLFGTFHFANPAKDLVKNRIHDVTTKDSQAYLQELAQRILAFRPTAVLLEYDPKEDRNVNMRYTQYREDKYSLATNEIEQLGFRVAKIAGLARVESFDERIVSWKPQDMFERLKQEPELEKRFKDAVQNLTNIEEMNHSTLSLRNLLKKYNEPEMDRLSKSLYILTNVAGVDQNFAGADAAASWWHRNFRMLARIQKFAKPGERVLVIAGQAHIAVLRDLMQLDSNVTFEEIVSYL